MKETSKTAIYVGTAAVVLFFAWLASRPALVADSVGHEIGTEFFPDFKDPLLAKTLQVIQYDEKMATVHPFRVTQINGIWSLPSHENYPADADRQLAEAAASVMDLTKDGVIEPDDPSKHELYGVVDPEGVTSGAEGVGKKVVIEDASGKKLAQFIIGKADESQPGIRFVRVPGQDRVYRVKVDDDKLSTQFADWIEPDLLKLSPFDIERVVMNDHSVDEFNQSLIQRGRYTVGYDGDNSKWNLIGVQSFNSGAWTDVALGPDEELDSQKLNELKTALDDLKIVDVARKPSGVSANLRIGDELMQDAQSRASLASRGFYVAQLPGLAPEIFSNEGEVRCGMNTGVEYVLRFGEITGRGDNGEEAKKDGGEEAKKDGGEEAKKDGGDEAKKDGADEPGADEPGEEAGANRYLLVTVQFNEDLLAKPELEPLPGPQPAEPKPAEPQPQPKESSQEEAAAEELPESNDSEPSDSGPSDSAPNDSKPNDAGDKDADKKKKQDSAADELERIKKDNEQKLKEYNEKVEEGKKKVTELTDRFADWYYVISDATYKKIHLSSKDIIKKKEPAEGTQPGGADAPTDPLKQFDELKKSPPK